ncbi:nucleoside-diphosphate-sugar epimerase [Streptomyces sp. SPB162]|nr:nucleoside-diphosphate-sugar epimerase [Streptomyces sp. SPB162]
MRILLLGGTEFVGRAVAEEALGRGWGACDCTAEGRPRTGRTWTSPTMQQACVPASRARRDFRNTTQCHWSGAEFLAAAGEEVALRLVAGERDRLLVRRQRLAGAVQPP